MSRTYYEEKYGYWFKFGQYTDGLHVDISDGNNDILTKIRHPEAEIVIKQHNQMIDELEVLRKRLLDHIQEGSK